MNKNTEIANIQHLLYIQYCWDDYRNTYNIPDNKTYLYGLVNKHFLLYMKKQYGMIIKSPYKKTAQGLIYPYEKTAQGLIYYKTISYEIKIKICNNKKYLLLLIKYG